jgi:spore maturation protein CgeB
MRIGVVGPSAEDDLAWNVAAGLHSLGHEAVLLGSSRKTRATALGRSKALIGLRDLALRHPTAGAAWGRWWANQVLDRALDLILTVESLHPAAVERLVSSRRPTALWFPDAISNLGSMAMFDAPYTAIFFKEPLLVRRVKDLLTLPVYYLPEACNPDIHLPMPSLKAQDHVVVAGNYYPTRVRLLERLVEADIPLKLYGSALPHTARSGPLGALHTGIYLRGREKARAFAEGAAVLNNLHPAEIEGVNCRLFEAAGCGGAVVTEWRDVLPRLFDVKTDVRAFTTFESLCAILRDLLDTPDQARDMRHSASLRAHSDHTFAQRLAYLLDVL